MIDKVFVDSNILIYAHDFDAGAKQQRAADCLRELWDLSF
jgi:predicted nucleic acid-binding protein